MSFTAGTDYAAFVDVNQHETTKVDDEFKKKLGDSGYDVTSVSGGDNITPEMINSVLSTVPVSYTHLTLPTKRIV